AQDGRAAPRRLTIEPDNGTPPGDEPVDRGGADPRRRAGHDHRAGGHQPTSVTVPVVPSTSTVAPSGMRWVAAPADTTQGMPSSRLTMAAWENGEPTSTTTAAAGRNSGVHDGSVIGATSTSPGPSWAGSDGSSTTRAVPRALPGQPPTPWIASPADSVGARSACERRAQVSSGGGSPATTNGGS